MRHLVKGRKLNRTSSHKRALMRSLATALFEHKKISTTEAKAKELRPYAEKLITKAKQALANEQQGNLPEGQTIDIHNRRVVARDIQNKAVLQELFDAIAPTVEARAGGYCRIIKTGTRRGDGGRTAIIELVDWSAPQDGATATKAKKKKKKAPKASSPVKEAVEEVAAIAAADEAVEEVVEETPADEVVEAVEETVEETAEVTEEVVEEATEEVAEAVEETTEEVADEAPAEEPVEEVAEPAEETTEEVADEAPAEEKAETEDEVEDSADEKEEEKEDKKEDKKD